MNKNHINLGTIHYVHKFILYIFVTALFRILDDFNAKRFSIFFLVSSSYTRFRSSLFSLLIFATCFDLHTFAKWLGLLHLKHHVYSFLYSHITMFLFLTDCYFFPIFHIDFIYFLVTPYILLICVFIVSDDLAI